MIEDTKGKTQKFKILTDTSLIEVRRQDLDIINKEKKICLDKEFRLPNGYLFKTERK